MSEESAVKVAVRVRPFNEREAQQGAECIVDMVDGQAIYLTNPETNKPISKVFNFDYALWSHDKSRPFVNQDSIYETIGKGLLSDFWTNQFNVCLFAYGQSGAGKSFSMTGSRRNKSESGIIPRICDDVMKNMRAEQTEQMKFKLKVGMCEIYMNKVQDLLIDKRKRPVDGLKIVGNELPDLTMVETTSSEQVMALLEQGQANQTIAATGLNAESSRGHTIFYVVLERRIVNVDPKTRAQKEVVQSIQMKLIDLAGSEKVDKVREGLLSGKVTAEEMAQREKEGQEINQSLTFLGMVIKKIAKASSLKDAKDRSAAMAAIPWRNTKLTHLLRHSLSGNCKTVMIAAISPSASEFAETYSTLNYANMVKEIRTSVKRADMSGSAEAIALQQAKEEIQRLEKLLQQAREANMSATSSSSNQILQEELNRLKAEQAEQIEIARRQAEEAGQREKEAAIQLQRIMEEKAKMEKEKGFVHLMKVLEDQNLNGLFIESLSRSVSVAGSEIQQCQIVLDGYKVESSHCRFLNEGGRVQLEPIGKAVCMVNGQLVNGRAALHHNDRIVLGQSNYFRFIDPTAFSRLSPAERQADDQKYTYDYIRKEALEKVLSAFKSKKEAEDEQKFQQQLQQKLREKEEEWKVQQAVLLREQENKRKEYEDQMKLMQERMKMDHVSQHQVEMEKKLKEAKEKMQSELQMMQADMMAKSEAERRGRDELVKLEEKKKLQRKHLIEAQLMSILPAIKEANDYSQLFSYSIEFKVKLLASRNYSSVITEVYVEMKHTVTHASMLLDLNDFHFSLSQMREMVKKYRETQKIPKIDESSPFFVDDQVPRCIGLAMIPLQYVYFGMDYDGTVAIVDSSLQPRGHIQCRYRPMMDDQAAAALDGVDDLSDLLGRIRHVDLDLMIEKVYGLPEYNSSKVYVEVMMPPWVANKPLTSKNTKQASTNQLSNKDNKQRNGSIRLDLGVVSDFVKNAVGAISSLFSSDDDEHEHVFEDQMGGSYCSSPYPGASTNQILNYELKTRLTAVDEQVIQWFRDGYLFVKVWGSTPPNLSNNQYNTEPVPENHPRRPPSAQITNKAAAVEEEDDDPAELKGDSTYATKKQVKALLRTLSDNKHSKKFLPLDQEPVIGGHIKNRLQKLSVNGPAANDGKNVATLKAPNYNDDAARTNNNGYNNNKNSNINNNNNSAPSAEDQTLKAKLMALEQELQRAKAEVHQLKNENQLASQTMPQTIRVNAESSCCIVM